MSKITQFITNSGTGGYIQTLTGNSGGAVPPTAGNINVVGSGSITVTGTPGTSTLTISSSGGGGVTSITGDSGGALTGALTLTGGASGAVFAGAGTTATMSFNNVSLPDTTSTVGQIEINSITVFHSYGTNNVFIGPSSGNFTLSSISTNCVGGNTGAALTSGTGNNFFGFNAGNRVTTGSNNLLMGQACGRSFTTGSGNVVLGGNLTSASNSATGSNNIVIGAANASFASSESYNILLNANGNSLSNTLKIGAGTGTGTNQLNAAYISGIYGITTSSATTSTVLVSDGNQLGTMASSERFKNTINDMGNVSEPIMNLRPVTFYYNAHKDNVLQYGLIAEEVNKVMPEIVNLDNERKPFSVRYHDLVPMLLNEVQKLRKELNELKGK